MVIAAAPGAPAPRRALGLPRGAGCPGVAEALGSRAARRAVVVAIVVAIAVATLEAGGAAP